MSIYCTTFQHQCTRLDISMPCLDKHSTQEKVDKNERIHNIKKTTLPRHYHKGFIYVLNINDQSLIINAANFVSIRVFVFVALHS